MLDNPDSDVAGDAPSSPDSADEYPAFDTIAKELKDSLENNIKPAVKQLTESDQLIHWHDNLSDWLNSRSAELQRISSSAKNAAQKTRATFLNKNKYKSH